MARFKKKPDLIEPPSDSVCFVLTSKGACLEPSVATYAPKDKLSVYIAVCEKHRKDYDQSPDFTRTSQFKPREESKWTK